MPTRLKPKSAYQSSDTLNGPSRIVEADLRATVTIREAAALLGVSTDVAYESARRGELPTLRFGRRVVVSRRVLERILAGEQLEIGVRDE